MPAPLLHPDIRRRLKDRLLLLPPRAFELFAGDLLVFIGLEGVEVTRYTGDGGIDAYGELIGESGLLRVPTGVQVKRHRHNVQRADIDRFIGALGGHFHHGLFITTAGYAPQARQKAITSPLLRIDTVDGEQLVALMRRHNLGVHEDDAIDENYFEGFEAQAIGYRAVHESPGDHQPEINSTGAATRPEDDLISLRALSYLLRIGTTTIRNWIERGRLSPDRAAV